MKALVIGASGAVGAHIVKELLNHPSYDEVHIFVRKSTGIVAPKLTEHIVDFDVLYDWAKELTGDVLFSSMGTSKRAAGSKDAQWRVDYDYQYNVARMAAHQGVGTYALVSSAGANADSSFFYLSMKGFLEEAVEKMEFKHIVIARPASLIRPKPKLAEVISCRAFGLINRVGLAKDWEPIDAAVVAHALVEEATGRALKGQQEGLSRTCILSNRHMLDRYKG